MTVTDNASTGVLGAMLHGWRNKRVAAEQRYKAVSCHESVVGEFFSRACVDQTDSEPSKGRASSSVPAIPSTLAGVTDQQKSYAKQDNGAFPFTCNERLDAKDAQEDANIKAPSLATVVGAARRTDRVASTDLRAAVPAKARRDRLGIMMMNMRHCHRPRSCFRAAFFEHRTGFSTCARSHCRLL